MKDLVIAAVIVAVLIGGWAVFDHYSEKKIDSFSSYIEAVSYTHLRAHET